MKNSFFFIDLISVEILNDATFHNLPSQLFNFYLDKDSKWVILYHMYNIICIYNIVYNI